MNVLSSVFRTEGPYIDRIRHDVRRRSLRVESAERVTPGMLRLMLSGEDLADFRSAGFDDHVKLIVPGTQEMRDYTPRRYDAERRIMALDFAVHEAGPATSWALAAKPGDMIDIAGPKGSSVISREVRRWLLIGDETALPAIGRCIQEAPPTAEITSIVAVASPEEEQRFETKAAVHAAWAYRPLASGADAAALLEQVRHVDLAPATFVWIAAEATVARALRDHLVEERQYPRGWTKAGGYWIKGRPAGRERIG